MKPTQDNVPKPASLPKGDVNMLSQKIPAPSQAGVKSVIKGD